MRYKLSKTTKIGISLLLFTLIFALSPSPQYEETGAAANHGEVIPGGETVGIKLYMDGLLVVGFSEILSYGKYYSPGRSGGLREGDIITAINGNPMDSGDAMSDFVQNSKGDDIAVTFLRGERKITKNITPVYYNDACQYKIGVWIKESAAGIGTVTFINPETNSFAALGHGVSDTDTGDLIHLNTGNITGCSISSIIKGERGYPGELKGVFSGDDIGSVYTNQSSGIYGKFDTVPESRQTVPVASHSEVYEGKAVILSDAVDGEIKEYAVEIQRIIKQNIKNSKGFIIKVTDPVLLDKTGGIVQGMSGSPIIQDGKLVGAITHV